MPTLTVKFKTPTKAAEFSKNFGVVGIKAVAKVDGSNVIVSTKDAKTHEFVKQMVSDLKAETKMESVCTGFLKAVVESANDNKTTEVKLYDDSLVSVDPNFAVKFIEVHENIEEETYQAILRSLAVESVESFNKTKKFVTEEQE
jgi:hypothetical protein